MPIPAITPELLIKVITFMLPFLFALCFHEFAHAWMARRFGDNTAYVMGRYTLNPMAHIDWLGTIILPVLSIVTGLLLFGWAKPVPVNPRNLSRPRQQMFWIALAGPLSNVLLFIVGLGVFAFMRVQAFFVPSQGLYDLLGVFMALNLYLAAFNMLPLHPLDGGKVIARFIPLKWDRWLEEQQYFLQMALLLLVIFGGLRILALPVNFVLYNSIGFVEAMTL